MSHLLILSYLPIIILGTFAISLARRADRDHAAQCARPMFYYLIFLNLLVLVYLTAKYAVTNVSPEESPDIQLLAHVGVVLGSFMATSGSTYWLLQTAYAVWMQECPRLVTRLFFVGICLFGLSGLVGIGILFNGGDYQWLMMNNLLLVITATLFCLAISVGLIISRCHDNDHLRSKAVRWLGIALLIGYCVSFASSISPRSWRLILFAISLFWLNLATLRWLQTQARYFYPAASIPDISQALDTLAAQHTITKREREVMELLFEGKSYKEIEDRLCISLGTVKNHTYNMYRKLGINSRAQLIHLAIGARRSTG